MTANKNNPDPGEEKIYQADNYRLSSSTPELGYRNSVSIDNSARQKDIPVGDENLDHLVRTPATNESYQHEAETHGKRTARGINPDELVYSGHVTHPARQGKTYPTGPHELSQPIWFYMIMKKLAAEKEQR